MSGRIWHSSALLDVYIHRSNLCFCCHMTIFPLCLCVFIWCFLLCVFLCPIFFFLIWTQLSWIRAHANDLILAWICLQRPYFQLRSQVTGTQDKYFSKYFWGDQSSAHDSDHSCCSVAHLCPTLRPHRLQHIRLPCLAPSLELVQTHVRELVMPSNLLILCRPFLLLPSIFPQHQGLF